MYYSLSWDWGKVLGSTEPHLTTLQDLKFSMWLRSYGPNSAFKVKQNRNNWYSLKFPITFSHFLWTSVHFHNEAFIKHEIDTKVLNLCVYWFIISWTQSNHKYNYDYLDVHINIQQSIQLPAQLSVWHCELHNSKNWICHYSIFRHLYIILFVIIFHFNFN